MLDSRVYRKVSISSEKLFQQNLRKVFIYTSNRFIYMKAYYPHPVWLVWKWLVMVYSFFWFKLKYQVSFYYTLKFIFLLNRYSSIDNDAREATKEKLYQEVGI